MQNLARKKTFVYTISSGVPIRTDFYCWRIPKKKNNTIFRNAFTFLCLKVLCINPSHNTASSAIPACSHHVYTSVEKASVIQTFDAFSFDI